MIVPPVRRFEPVPSFGELPKFIVFFLGRVLGTLESCGVKIPPDLKG